MTSTVGARTALSNNAGLTGLGSGAYVLVGTIDHDATKPDDVLLEVNITPGTVSGNKQAVVFAQRSLDGTTFETGPTSGTTTTDETNLTFIGTVPCNSNGVAQTKAFALGDVFGPLPKASRIVIKNETGAALASGSVNFAPVAFS